MKNKITGVSAAILAGGKNSRMQGENKAFLQLGGISLIERTMAELKKIFGEIIIVTNAPKDFALYRHSCVVVEDQIKKSGPLAGMHSALSATSQPGVFFVACDMPFLHNGLISRQIDCFKKIVPEAVVPKIGALIEPLHAVYSKKLKDKIYQYLKNNDDYSIKRFLKTINVHYWELEDNAFNRRVFRNLNTPQDLKEARQLCR